ncbi:MAG: DUF4910 domain-containing protein [Planctomycetota bacterium]
MSVNLQERLKTAAGLISEKSILELLQMVWKNDRLFTFPAFQTTARIVSAKLAEWDVKTEITDLPADGKTIFGDWKMPLGWDCSGATLEIIEPSDQHGRIFADRQNCPAHVVMWSGPTPPEGLTAEVVKIMDAADLRNKCEQVVGKIVYTPEDALSIKKAVADAGAIALVSSHSPCAEQFPDACAWVNGWSDDSGGWAFHVGDTPLPGMSISPRMGRELDALLTQGSVKLNIKVASEYMETTMPILSGFIAGVEPSEILTIGHAMEQGANDNASGVAVILESLRVLREATRSGALPPLRRGVRGLLVNECYGTIGYAARNPKILKRMVAGINWDSLARHQESVGAKFKHIRCPDALASVADTLMLLLLDAWLPHAVPHINLKKDRPFSLTDNAYCDPALGVECVYVESQDSYWHTSADTPDQISGATLRAFTTISVTYLHFLATATAREAMWLAHQTAGRYGKQLEEMATKYALKLEENKTDRPIMLAQALDHLAYICEIGEKAVMSARRLMSREEKIQNKALLAEIRRHLRKLTALEGRRLKSLADCEAATLPVSDVIADIAELRPLKKFIGTPTYDSIPLEKRSKTDSPMWRSSLHCALFWSQGKLPFREIARRVSYEFSLPTRAVARLAEDFRFMAENNLIEWQAAVAAPKKD